MKNWLLALFLLCFAHGFAQYEITIKANIYDYETQKPIPYVNIGFLEKRIGTVSDDDGSFILVYDEDAIGMKDFLQISALGYETIKVTARQLVRLLTNTDKIYMKPKPVELDEVFLTDEQLRPVYLGDPEVDLSAMGYWKDKNALGGEIATVLDIKKKRTKLRKLSFTVVENRADSLKVRINVYNYRKGYPQEKLTNSNIYHTIVPGDSLVTIDLEPHNIRVDRDCIIGIELVKVYGDIIEFAVSGKLGRGTSYKRYVSQDKWERNSRIGINFGVEAGVPLKKGETYIEKREPPSRITIYWDNSTLDKSRKLAAELDFLESYLKELRNVEAEVIRFNSYLNSRKVFSIDRGRTDEIIEYLKDTKYTGAVDYAGILKTNEFDAETILLFTDGRTLFTPLEPEVYVPTFTVNSSSEADHFQLQRTAYYADGHYINLMETSPREAMEFILNEVQDTVDYTLIEGERFVINGKVFTASGPVQGATIRVKGTFVEAQSDIDGFFRIEAEEDDILLSSFLGLKTKETQIVNPRNVAILMEAEGELLDEVVLSGEKKEEAEFDTGRGKRKKRSLGYSADEITADDIGPQYTNLADLLVGRFPGVQVAGLNVGYNTPRFIIRGGTGSITNTAYAMFDIDGIVYSSDQIIPFVDPQNIARISILRSIIATNRYGQIGRGGAIVIRTKFFETETGEELDSALVQGNDYNSAGVILLENNVVQKPAYLKALEQAASFDQAKDIYFRQMEQPENYAIPFYIDASEYFMRWNPDFAYNVLTSIAAVADRSPKALKTLAFKLESLGKMEEAEKIYEWLLALRPKHEQPYRDLARIYADNGKYQKAMTIYRNILADAVKDVDFIGLKKTIEKEIMHLLAFHRSKVDYSDFPLDLRTANFKHDIRMVFDWNDPNTEFEIQFVNPQKKYYNWSHSMINDEDSIMDAVKYGYNTEEFIIDDAPSGQWIVNIRSLTEEDISNPTYLKYTVYQNYGLPEESKTVKVVKLYQQQSLVTLDAFNYR